MFCWFLRLPYCGARLAQNLLTRPVWPSAFCVPPLPLPATCWDCRCVPPCLPQGFKMDRAGHFCCSLWRSGLITEPTLDPDLRDPPAKPFKGWDYRPGTQHLCELSTWGRKQFLCYRKPSLWSPPSRQLHFKASFSSPSVTWGSYETSLSYSVDTAPYPPSTLCREDQTVLEVMPPSDWQVDMFSGSNHVL